MGLLDIAVLSALGILAAYPLILPALGWTAGLFAAGSADSVEKWRQQWVTRLITLSREIESGKGGVGEQKQARMLCNELMWEIIGGDQTSAKSKP
jgi:hypothetical protein